MSESNSPDPQFAPQSPSDSPSHSPAAEAESKLSDTQPQDEEQQQQDATSQEEPANVNGEMIKDLFNESESEDEEFEGFKKPETNDATNGDSDDEGPSKSSQNKDEGDNDNDGDEDGKEKDLDSMDPSQLAAAAGLDDSSSDDDIDDDAKGSSRPEMVYDFDVMMQRKREENYMRRKRKNVDIINDSDDIIAEMIENMKNAAERDFEMNKAQKPATCKLNLLKKIESTLKKIDLREALLDSGILGVITDWLTPLPDRSLPNISIRTSMLALLSDFNVSDTDRLKASGIGKAVMYLYKHPKETKDNKERARRLISAWSRPIFHNDMDFHSMTKEDREARDLELMSKSKKSRVSTSSSSEPSTPAKKGSQEKGPQPGEKGWVPRARVPLPSTRDYVNRPRSLAEDYGSRGSSKKVANRFEMMQRQFNEKKKALKVQRAVKISIEGRKM